MTWRGQTLADEGEGEEAPLHEHSYVRAIKMPPRVIGELLVKVVADPAIATSEDDMAEEDGRSPSSKSAWPIAAMAEEANQLAADGRLYSAIFYVLHSL